MSDLRLCLNCRTKYEPIPMQDHCGIEACPNCSSRYFERAVPSDYRAPEHIPGSSKDYEVKK